MSLRRPMPDWKRAIGNDALDGLLRKIHKERGLDRAAVARLLGLDEGQTRRFLLLAGQGRKEAKPRRTRLAVENWLLLAVRAIDAGITVDDIVYPDAVAAIMLTANEVGKRTDDAIKRIGRASWMMKKRTGFLAEMKRT